jgi:hypothetical protein
MHHSRMIGCMIVLALLLGGRVGAGLPWPFGKPGVNLLEAVYIPPLCGVVPSQLCSSARLAVVAVQPIA